MEITTSRRQGQAREGLSEGSPSAKVRAEEHELHRRLSLRASQHKMTKPNGASGQGKCGGCALKAHVLIRGALSDMAVQARGVRHQPGHWLTKVQAHGVLPPHVSEAGSAHASEYERAAE
jgi:hypothetical protein